MTSTLLEKLVKDRSKRRLKKEKPSNLLLTPTTIPSLDQMEELAIELRDYFFGKSPYSYILSEAIINYHELGQALIELDIVKNYDEFNKILCGLNNLTIKYDTAWQSCQLEINKIQKNTKKLEEIEYILRKRKFPFPKERQIEDPNKTETFSIKKILEED